MKDVGLYALLIGAWIVLPLFLVLWVNGFFKRLPPEEKAKDRFSLRLTRARKKRSYGICPWCRSEIELVRGPRRAFECPVCGCAFRHNYAKWAVALPLVLFSCVIFPGVARKLPVLRFVPAIVWFFAGLVASLAATARMPDYRIIDRGTDPPPPPAASEEAAEDEDYAASQHLSIHKPKQLAAALTLIAIATIVVLFVCWLISRLMS